MIIISHFNRAQEWDGIIPAKTLPIWTKGGRESRMKRRKAVQLRSCRTRPQSCLLLTHTILQNKGRWPQRQFRDHQGSLLSFKGKASPQLPQARQGLLAEPPEQTIPTLFDTCNCSFIFYVVFHMSIQQFIYVFFCWWTFRLFPFSIFCYFKKYSSMNFYMSPFAHRQVFLRETHYWVWNQLSGS